jgi:hypothetical protein
MKWIYRFFVVLGVIFFLLLVGLTYFVIADPLHIRPFLSAMYEKNKTVSVPDSPEEVDTNPTSTAVASETVTPVGVSIKQAEALESVGINPAAVPTKFTPEQVACFVTVLGQSRVDAIVAGDTPTPAEFFTAKNCL